MCLTNDLLLNSFLWTAALDLRLCNPELSDDQVLLSCHTRCLRHLRDRLQRSDVGDDIIHVVASLAICGDFSDVSERRLSDAGEGYGGSFDSPVKKVGMLHNVSRYKWSNRHYDVLRLLVRNKGGLQNVNFPGIAETVQTIELFQASTHIGVPDLGLSETYRFVLDHHTANIRPQRIEIEGFLVAIGEDSLDFRDVLLDVRMFCKLVSHAESQDQKVLPQSQLLTYRNLIQRRILLLPRGREPKDSMYEICRLATLIFSYGVIYPLRGGEQLGILVQSLIKTSRQHDCMPEEAEFLLWALMVGALGSIKKSQENFFVHRLAMLSQAQDVLRWREALEVFDKFLWLDDACNVGGEAIWTEVAALRLKNLC